ncbi:site-specific DNA-methyltransferase [uncultured Fibrobacter sp.]|uniref:site-specific DNA-methyltransferase n=1 Tax=uncultured Fibrobacter sp. TaxID=261512 RepID=UPI002593CE8A|nr:site-specific DNA-methyltransferase [uncultured Fibrobacter sp.]
MQENLSHATIGEGEERYQFTWPGKREAIHNANAPTNMTLRPCKEESVDFDNTQNLYIEGDNLEVLKLLQENYLGKIKMIYIDPPYNTGNDFVYNDDFKEDTESFQSKSGMYDEDGNMLLQNFEKNTESNGRFHTDWLNMMYPRLKVARNLLSDDGVIFISIDDNEQENLKKICSEIFGENNFVGQWNWFKSATPPALSKKIKKNIEYIFVYQKGKNEDVFRGVKKESPSNDPITKPQNSYKELTFKSGTVHAKFPDGTYKKGIYGTDKFPNELLNDLIVENGVNKNDVTFKNRFIWIQETLNEQIKSGTKIELSKQLVISYKKAEYNREVPPNLIDSQVGVDTTENAGRSISQIFDGKKIFDYPKPTSLLTYLINFFIQNNENALILDFFSGSATTAHAVMQLNAEDNGNRKFICVQLPEVTAEESEAYKAGYKTICEIGKERIRRAGKKIMDDIIANNETSAVIARSETTKQSKDSAIDCRASLAMTQNSQLKTDNYKLDIGFRVLKLAESNMKDVFYSPAETTSADIFDVDNVKEDRTPLDLLFQVMPECNLPLSSKIEERTIEGKTVYFVNGNYLVACFDEGITEKLIKAVIDVPDSDKPYYFYMRGLGLESDKVLDNFEQLFVHYSPTTKRKVI